MVKLRNVSGADLEVDALGVTVKAGGVLAFDGHLAKPEELAEHLDLPPGAAPAWPDDAIHAWVDRAEHVLAWPTATWVLVEPMPASTLAKES